MRRERLPADQDAGTTAYTFHFQIINNGGRQACSVKVQAATISDATTFLRQNWPMIEFDGARSSRRQRRPHDPVGNALMAVRPSRIENRSRVRGLVAANDRAAP